MCLWWMLELKTSAVVHVQHHETVSEPEKSVFCTTSFVAIELICNPQHDDATAVNNSTEKLVRKRTAKNM